VGDGGQTAVTAQVSAQVRIVEVGSDDSRVMDHLDHLANRIGPRLAGSDNHQKACEWARDQFAAYGLANAHLEECGEVAFGFNRGPATGSIQSPISKTLHFSTPSWTPGTHGAARARAVMAPETIDVLESSRAQLEGAWVMWRPSGDIEKVEAYIKAWDAMTLDVAGVITPSSGEFIVTMGAPPVDDSELPTTPTIILLQSEWEQIADMLDESKDVSLEFDIQNHFKKGPIPIHNVVADIPGTEKPDEYVVIGAHIDSRDGAPGATDNGTGVAAAMEAARILMESGVKPKRTIRFILFGGEEVGLYGSRGYVRDHPELIPKISAMYNMDTGADYISGIYATEAMLDDFETVFASVQSLDSDMTFAIQQVEYLPQAVDCGASPKPSSSLNPSAGCGGVSPPSVDKVSLDDVDLDADTTPGIIKQYISSGCGDVPSSGGLTLDTAKGCGSAESATTVKRKVVMFGSSDHAPFLQAGIPAFMWQQKGKDPVPYYPHTQKDTFDQVIPELQAHSATVIALAALGTANLDHLLSRENLQEEPGSSDSVSVREE